MLKNSGFTLVETTMVLAIAGLIMVLVFTGVQGAQRSRRDAVRKVSLDSFVTRVIQFASNNGGRLPQASDLYTACSGDQANGCSIGQTEPGFQNDYFSDSTAPLWRDPSTGTVYQLIYTNSGADPRCSGFPATPGGLGRIRLFITPTVSTASVLLENGCYTLNI